MKVNTGIVGLLLAGVVGAAPAERLKSGVFEPPRPAPEIAQKAADGSEFKLSSLRGKVVVLEFGYTTCQNVCPVSLAQLAAARKQLGAAADALQVVFVSVDPERDTPEKLKRYLAQFDPSFIGLTGTPRQMEAIRNAYGIAVSKRPMGGDYMMAHSSYLYFIDPKGMLRALMPFGRPAAEIAHDVNLLVKDQ